MNNVVVECSSLNKIYCDAVAKIQVLNNVNLKVKKAEFITIVGNSGSGKSTLLHMLGGLDSCTSGEVRIAGKDLAKLSEIEKCKLRNNYLGFVYQFHHLLPEFTAIENVSMPLLIRGTPPTQIHSKATHLLESVGLKDRMLHKPGELSGGERQRVAIARALVTDPLCILADEPTGNLDPFNAEKVLQLFIDLQKARQMSVIMVTHDRTIAKQAERSYSLLYGKLVEE